VSWDDARPASGFLSEEWFEALSAAVRTRARRHLDTESSARPLRLGIRVGEVPWSPGGQFSYTVVLARTAEVVAGSEEGADVVLVASHAAWRALAEGQRTVGELLESGSIRVRGDVARLMAAGDLLSALSAPQHTDQSRTH
jgi:hypothetical protein